MSETKPFEGRVALVTGASRGIGAAIAKALAAKGAHVILTARDDAALERVEDEIHQAGGTATIAPVDLTENDGVARLAQAIASRWDALDFLVMSAAYLPTLTPVTQIDSKQFNTAVTINLLATQALIAGLHPLLKRADAARVVGLTSSVGESPRAYWSAYASTKAAFDNLLECYALEVANTGSIRVAIVDPGATRTQMRAKAYPGEDPQTVKPPEEVATRIAALLGEDFESGHRERIG
ncbi:SDR family NAD(P)-dependent oxidoreductase [Alteriqipengyuania sp. 357]